MSNNNNVFVQLGIETLEKHEWLQVGTSVDVVKFIHKSHVNNRINIFLVIQNV